jgi:predicted ATPase with chaperone activity
VNQPAPATNHSTSIPTSLDELRINPDLVAGLLLRVLAAAGSISGARMEQVLGIPYEICHPIVEDYVRHNLVELAGYAADVAADGRPVELRMMHVIAEAGRRRAIEIGELSTNYLGPCPVSLDDYTALARAQANPALDINPDVLSHALGDLELDQRVVEQIGSAMVSHASLFIYGAPGNGKSTITRRIVQLLGPPIDVPWAVAVGNEVIRLLDPIYHRLAGPQQPQDRRFASVLRPLVRAGGELQFRQLELTFDDRNRYYEAPLQWKANGGLLVVDDFGRQSESPSRLLNRFIVPMEEGVDFVDLSASGHKIEVPFTSQVVFSTNLQPAQLVDEAFLRRIAYKVLVPDPTAEMYARIFLRECERCGLKAEAEAAQFLIKLYGDRPLRGSHPHQLLARLTDRARFRGDAPVLNPQTIQEAFDTYLNPAFSSAEVSPETVPA